MRRQAVLFYFSSLFFSAASFALNVLVVLPKICWQRFQVNAFDVLTLTQMLNKSRNDWMCVCILLRLREKDEIKKRRHRNCASDASEEKAALNSCCACEIAS